MSVAHAAAYAPESSSTAMLAPLVKLGGLFVFVTVIVKVTGALASLPPPATPPSSDNEIVTVAAPCIPVAGVKVSTPDGLTAGCAENRPLLLLLMLKETVWPDSFGPAVIAVAHAPEYAPES